MITAPSEPELAQVVRVAAFEPFGGRSRNRALEAALRLAGLAIGPSRIEVAVLPTVFAALGERIAALCADAPPLLLLVGEAPSRSLLIERLAVNIAHARIADNAGAQPVDEEVIAGGEPARRVSFDPRIAANAALAAGVRCEVSSHAGTFCCNAAFYHALGEAAHRAGRTQVAFVHVPSRWPWAHNERGARGLLAIAHALTSRRQLG